MVCDLIPHRAAAAAAALVVTETELTVACNISELTLRVLTLKLNPKYAQAYGRIETERYQWAKVRNEQMQTDTVH